MNYPFTYFSYPQSLRKSHQSNNITERMNKEVRRRTKVMDYLPTEDPALKIVYLRVAELIEKWYNRMLNGHSKSRDELNSIFSTGYP